MVARPNVSGKVETTLVFTGMIVDPTIAEADYRVSVAGNRFQLKLVQTLSPQTIVNIAPLFLTREQSMRGLASREISLATRVPGPWLVRALAKVIGDACAFLRYVATQRHLAIVFYNLDYSNVLLALIARVLGHRVFVVAADYVEPATNVYQRVLLWTYRRMNGVLALRSPCDLNSKVVLLPAIIDDLPDCPDSESLKFGVLFAGSIGETTGLDLVLDTAVACPGIRFYVTGRPFHLSEQRLRESIDQANSNGATIEYLGMLPFDAYRRVLCQSEIALTLRNPADPDHENNFPSKIAEFMAAGKVVVSSLRYPELPDDTYVRVQYSADSLAAALERLAAEPALRQRIASRAQGFSKSSFSSESARRTLRQLIFDA